MRFEALPDSWKIGKPGFGVRVVYRNAPRGAGLDVSINRYVPFEQLSQFSGTGGGLTAKPIPIEGDGVVEVPFDGIAYSGATDAAVAYPLKNGDYIFLATLLNHRRTTIGWVIREKSDRKLAETLSRPIAIREN